MENNAKFVVSKLIENKISIACCESLTGGQVASSIVSVPGASEIFGLGIVTYSNEAKINELGVKKETLDKFGAVSSQTALEMAQGLYNKTGADICISTTGIAGPGGGSPEKPVGTVYICVLFYGKGEPIKCLFSGQNRENVQFNTVKSVFDTIREQMF